MHKNTHTKKTHVGGVVISVMENRYCYVLKILFWTVSFWRNIKWAWKAYCVAITILKNVSTVAAKYLFRGYSKWLQIRQEALELNREVS